MHLSLSDKQREFVSNKSRFSGFVGGVRSGKSFAGTVKSIKQALRKRSVGAVVAPTYPMIRDVILPLWRLLLPKGAFKKFSQTQNKLWLRNGSVILFRSAEIPERLYGLTLDYFHLDEAAIVDRKTWDTLYSRVISTKGLGFITTTPNGHNWVWELVSNNILTSVFAKTLDNPLMDPDEVENAKKMLDPKFFRQQYEASFEAYLGQVYDDFCETNIRLITPDITLPIYVCADFGWRNPTALLWAQQRPDGTVEVFDEIVESFMTPEIICAILKSEKVILPSGKRFQAKVAFDEIDGLVTGFEATQSRQESGGFAMVDQLRRNGIDRIRIVGGSIVRGIFLVRAKILSASNKQKLYLDPSLKRLIADFRGYHYPEGVMGKSSELPEKDSVHDHTMDAMRYLITMLDRDGGKWIV